MGYTKCSQSWANPIHRPFHRTLSSITMERSFRMGVIISFSLTLRLLTSRRISFKIRSKIKWTPSYLYSKLNSKKMLSMIKKLKLKFQWFTTVQQNLLLTRNNYMSILRRGMVLKRISMTLLCLMNITYLKIFQRQNLNKLAWNWGLVITQKDRKCLYI